MNLLLYPSPRVWTPRQIPGIKVWATAKDISGVDEDGAISSWRNRIAGVGDLAQATGSRQPVYKADSFTGAKPCVRFASDGTRDDSLGVTFDAVSQPYWLALVGRYRATNASAVSIYALGGTNAVLGITSVATNLNVWFAGNNIVLDDPADTDPHIWIGIFNGTSSLGESDGEVKAGMNAGTNTWVNLTVGASNNVNSTIGTELDAAEVLFGAGPLNNANRLRLRRHLRKEWPGIF